MRKRNLILLGLLILSGLLISQKTQAQIRFEVSLPGIHIVAGEPYPNVIIVPNYYYNVPLPEGYYYYDEGNDCYYDNDNNVYYYPTNVYVRHDNGRHKGWHKKKHRHDDDDDNDHDGD